MTGSYGHCCNDDGSFRFDLIENLGDAHEACEDMHRRIAELEAKLAEERMIATKQANRLEEMDAELLYAEAKLAKAQADSERLKKAAKTVIHLLSVKDTGFSAEVELALDDLHDATKPLDAAKGESE